MGKGKGQDPLLGFQESMRVNQVMGQGLLDPWAPNAHNNQEVNETENETSPNFQGLLPSSLE